MDDFPVLKAFQQYIDSEQAKARKRLVMLGVFFCILIGAVIAVFVAMLASVTARNQQLNDRLVEFAMKERAAAPTAAVQPQPMQDNAVILAMTERLEKMQKQLDDSRAKAEKEAAVAAERARIAAQQAAKQEAKPKGPSKEELEIKRLNALLEIERQKAAAEKERRLKEEAAAKEKRRQEELEAYRRKQYPELYKPKPEPAPAAKAPTPPAKPAKAKAKDIDAEIDAIVAELDNDSDDDGAISYFDDDEQPAQKAKPKAKKKAQKSVVQKPAAKKPVVSQEPEPTAKADDEEPATYKIPVEVKRTGGRRWHVPVD
jgi:colicin import membrane protein